MRRKSIMKKCLAAILSFAMTVTLFPANSFGTVQAADGPQPVLHWDMSHAAGKLKDISGNNLDGKLVGLDNSDFVTMDDGVSQELMFEGEDKNKYVEIPAGALKKQVWRHLPLRPPTRSQNSRQPGCLRSVLR